MQPSIRFPKTVEFLRNAMIGKEGFDLAIAQELTQLVNELGKVSGENSALKAENDALGYALQMAQEYIEYMEDPEPIIPQYPGDFYVYGQSPMSQRLNDEAVQFMVDEVYDIPLEDGEYVEVSQGDTLVIKFRDGDIEKVIVAKDYAEVVKDADDLDDFEDDDDDDCDPDCGVCIPCGILF